MAYDESVAGRVRKALAARTVFSERKMFGGLCFLVGGNMCCGVQGRELMLRLGNEGAAQALTEPHTREMDFTGRPIRSMLYLSSDGFRSEDDLHAWIGRAVAFAKTLPPK